MKSRRLLLISLMAAGMGYSQPTRIDITDGPIPIQILVQGPAETVTELQVICLFRSTAANALHGSLVEINEKLKGLLDRVRKPDYFRGELGETLLITAPRNSLGAKKLLIIGLGDSETFSPQRMRLVGETVYRQASDLGVAHPYFAPTILDGGVSKFATGDVASEAVGGFLRAAATDKVLQEATAAAGSKVSGLTFLAGAKNVASTRDGIEKAIAQASTK